MSGGKAPKTPKTPKTRQPAVPGLQFIYPGEEVAAMWRAKARRHEERALEWQREREKFRKQRDEAETDAERQRQQKAYDVCPEYARKHEIEAVSCRWYADHVLTDRNYILGLQELAMLNPHVPLPKES